MSEEGHNSKNAVGAELLAFVERIEKIEAEKKELANDVKDVYGEAHGRGFDKKALRRIVAGRKKDRKKVEEENTVFQTYCHAIGAEYLA